MKVLTQKNIKIIFFVVLLIKFCADDKFTKRIVVYRGENASFEFIKAILKEYKYYRKVMNKDFNQKFDHE